jgi:hypothetical protein
MILFLPFNNSEMNARLPIRILCQSSNNNNNFGIEPPIL